MSVVCVGLDSFPLLLATPSLDFLAFFPPTWSSSPGIFGWILNRYREVVSIAYMLEATN